MTLAHAGSMVVVVAALLAVGGVAGAQERGGDEPGAVRQLTDTVNPSRTHEYPSVAVDPTDRRTVVAADVEFVTSTCLTHISTNGGRTWTEGASPQSMGYSNCGITNHNFYQTQWSTGLAYAPDGTLYYAFAAAKPADGMSRSILLARSTDDGRSWETTVVHRSPPGSGRDATVHVRPSGAVDRDNPQRVAVGWRYIPGKWTKRPTQMWMAVSNDGGATFGEPAKLGAGDFPSVAIADNAVYAFFPAAPEQDQGPSATQQEQTALVMSKSTDGGRTFKRTTLTTAAALSPPIATVDPTRNTLVVTWSDNRLADDGVRNQVFVSRSTNGGQTWSDPVAVAPNPPDGARENVNEIYPSVAVAPNGRVDVAWYDYRNDPFPVPRDADPDYLGQMNDVFVASSTDGGRTLANEQRVTRTPIDRRIGTWNSQYFLLGHPGIAATNAGWVTAWSDTTNGRPDVQAPQDIFAAASAGFAAAAGAQDETEFAFGWKDWLLAAELFLGGLGLALLVAWAMLRRRRPEATSERVRT